MKRARIWVATFDAGSCRVFNFNGNPRRLEEIVEERRTGPHKPAFADRAGREHSRLGERRSAMAPRTDAERRLETEFVGALATHLTAKAQEGAFDELIVAASPRALGAFRAAAPKSLADRVACELHGSYVNEDERRLHDALASEGQ